MTNLIDTDLHDLGTARAPATLLSEVLVRTGLADAYTVLQSPVGATFVAYNQGGISAVRWAVTDSEFGYWFERQFGRRAVPARRAPEALARELRAGLNGERRPRLRYDLRGLTEFERAVLLKAVEIPRGEVRPYSWIAREIGRPQAVRAVGTALGNNPIPLFIPCHRVVRADGRIGEYSGGGPETKKAILEAEGVSPAELERLGRPGARFHGSRTTHIFCFPTCRHARRVADRHAVEFGSEIAARAAGYRPCKVCRPALAS